MNIHLNMKKENMILWLVTGLLCLLYLFWADLRTAFLGILVCMLVCSLFTKKLILLRKFLVSFILVSFIVFFASGILVNYNDEHSMYVAEILFLFINLCFVLYLCFVSNYQLGAACEKHEKLGTWWICLFWWVILCCVPVMQAIFVDFIENTAFYFSGYKLFLLWFLPAVYILGLLLYRLYIYVKKEQLLYRCFFWKFMLCCNLILLAVFLSFAYLAASKVIEKLKHPEEVYSQDVVIDDTYFDMDVIVDGQAAKVITEQAYALNIIKDKCYKDKSFNEPLARQKIRECLLVFYQKCLDAVAKSAGVPIVTETIPLGTAEEIHQKLENKLKARALLSGEEMKTFCALPSEADIAEDKMQGIMYSEVSFGTLWSREEAECLAQAEQYGIEPEILLDVSAKEIKKAKRKIVREAKRQQRRLEKIKARAERVQKWKKQKEAERIVKEEKKQKKIAKKMNRLHAEREAFKTEQEEQKLQFENMKKEYEANVSAIQDKYDAEIKEVRSIENGDANMQDEDKQLYDLQFARAKKLAEQEDLWQEKERIFKERQKAEKQILSQWWDERARIIESGGKDISAKKARKVKKQLLQQVRQTISDTTVRQPKPEILKAEQEAFKKEQEERKLQHENMKKEYEARISAIQDKYDTEIKELRNQDSTGANDEAIKKRLYDLQFARAKELAEQEHLWLEEDYIFKEQLKEEREVLRQWWNERERTIADGGTDISAEEAQQIKEELLSQVGQKIRETVKNGDSLLTEELSSEE